MRFLPFIFLAAFAVPASALVVQDESAANHAADATWAPAVVWDNIGVAGDSTGVYLGDGWIVTANHVLRTDETHTTFQLTLDGVTYGWTGIGFQLGTHDLFLARLEPDGNGNLPDAYGATGLALATETPEIGAEVTLIGYGRNTAAIDYYAVSGETWTLSAETDPAAVAVYAWGPAPVKTWGTNLLWATTAAGSTLDGQPLASFTVAQDAALAIDFSAARHGTLPASQDAATLFEAGAAVNDSGGALVVNVDGVYRLAGLLDTIATWPGQPGNSTAVGNATFAIDLAAYAGEINAAIVPEPGVAALLAFGAVIGAGSRRFGRRGA